MKDIIKQKLTQLGLKPGERLGVAVSGGVDSMALLHCLLCLDVPVTVYHMEHGIRGGESKSDMDFVEAQCRRLGIECVVKRTDVPQLAEELGVSVETAARKARYEFLDDAPQLLMATAHHMDDLAETVIMNLVRGSGLKGLGGIPEKRGKYIRPMLGVSRSEIEQYAKANDIRYVEDSTNDDTSYTRNYIRKKILPELREINEAAVQNISRTAGLLSEDEAALIKAAVDCGCVEFGANEAKIDLEAFARQCNALKKRIIRLAVAGVFDLVDVENVHIDSILELASKGISGKAVDLKYGLFASVAYDKLIIGKNPDKGYNYNLVALKSSGCFESGGYAFETSELLSEEKPEYSEDAELFDADVVKNSILRQRQEGDYIVPLGMKGKKRLSDYLSDRKVPLHRRDKLVVMAKGSEVFWVVGIGVSESSKVRSSSRIIKIKYRGNRL